MHFGRLPAAEPSAGGPAAPTSSRLLDRRGFAVLIAGAAASAGGWWLLGRPGVATTAAPRGSLEWALALAEADADALLPAAGDLERVAARHPHEQGLVPVFTRLLDCAVASQAGVADAAAACAVRALDQLGAAALVRARGDALAQRAGFVLARRELDYVLAPRRAGGAR